MVRGVFLRVYLRNGHLSTHVCVDSIFFSFSNCMSEHKV